MILPGKILKSSSISKAEDEAEFETIDRSN